MYIRFYETCVHARHSHKSILEVRHWCWLFYLFPKVFDGRVKLFSVSQPFHKNVCQQCFLWILLCARVQLEYSYAGTKRASPELFQRIVSKNVFSSLTQG